MSDAESLAASAVSRVPATERRSALPANGAGHLRATGQPRATGATLSETELSDAELAAVASEILRLTNLERRKRGVRPVAANACLRGYAQRWSVHMATTGKLAHQNARLLLRCGVNRAAENVAWSSDRTTTAAQIVALWLKSPPHRRNLLDAKYTQLGVGFAVSAKGAYATQDFGGR